MSEAIVYSFDTLNQFPVIPQRPYGKEMFPEFHGGTRKQ